SATLRVANRAACRKVASKMNSRRTIIGAVAAILIALGAGALAQWYGGDDLYSDRRGVPMWENEPRFKDDVFTFVRIEYDSAGGYYGRGGRRRFGGFEGQFDGGFGGRRGYGGGGWGGGRWTTDAPDSDLNFSFRLQQLTSLKVNPVPVHL